MASDRFFPSLRRELELRGPLDGRNGSHRSCIREIKSLAEDKAAILDYDEKKVELPSSVRSTFLMVFSPDGQIVASTHGDHKIYMSDMRTGKINQTLSGHPRTPWCLAFHPTLQNILASGCLAGEVRVWDLQSGACETWVNAHGSVIASLAFHPTDHVILIATYNELHFWDWRQNQSPMITLTTPSEKEKVRFVKFDSSGTKIITGVSNIPPLRGVGHNFTQSASSLLSLRRPPHTNTSPGVSDAYRDIVSSSSSLALRRSNLLSRVMSMYRHLEGLEESRATSTNSTAEYGTSNPAAELDELSRLFEGSAAAERVLERFTSNANIDRESPNTSRDTLSPTEEMRLQEARQYANEITREALLMPRRSATTFSPSPNLGLSEPEYFPADYTASLMSTFRRLHSLCSRLSQLMQEQPRTQETERESVSPSTSLSSLLTRLQQSLQSMSTAALTTAIAHEHIQQVRQRVAEILERLVNVSGYRARLSNLRDQIYEVAERISANSETSEVGSQRWDLIHCLWLVDMSIHLTRQMQRILAADYRFTQLTLSNTPPFREQRNSEDRASGTETSTSTSTPTNRTSTQPQRKKMRLDDSNLLSEESNSQPAPSTSTGITRPRFSLSRMPIRAANSVDESDFNSSSFTIPTVRISGPESEEDERNDSNSRPRSPPLPELQQTLNYSSRMPGFASALHDVHHIVNSSSSTSERFHVPLSVPSVFMPPTPPPSIGATQHIWFNPSSLYPEFGILGGGANLNYRIQCWDFSKFEFPNLKDGKQAFDFN